MNLFELTKRLVNIPSLPRQESEIAEFLYDYLKSLKFNVQAQNIEEKRKNLLATSGSKPRIILCTHMDTVPPYFAASEDEYFIYGRGACDAKGIIASMIWAAQELKEEGAKEIGLLFVVGEETDSIGARKASSLNMKSEFIIVGEPTENKLGVGHKGALTLKILARGKAAHSAYPNLGDSAIERLLDALQIIRTTDFGKDPTFGDSYINIGIIEGGEAPNVIADYACAEVLIRNAIQSSKILDMVKKGVKRMVEIKVLSQSDPQKLFTIPDLEHVVLPYGTDIPYLKNFGKPLLLGPGSALVAHTDKEKIKKRDLKEAVQIYKKLVRTLLTLHRKYERK